MSHIAVRLGLVLAGALLCLRTAPAGAAAVTVREPAFGLPHVWADTDLELARENGREIARDRLVQMILLARVGRGTLYQAFSALDPSTLDDDIEARRTAYTSSELNNMYAKLPQRERDFVLEYAKGVNDTLDAIYAGSLPEPLEVNILRALGLSLDLFGNATNVSDQVDPFYAPPGGAWPNSGFQFTPEMAIAIGVLEVRNFGLGGFDETARFAELQAFIAKHGTTAGTEIWSDYNFANDPLAPATVPDPALPGYGGPLAFFASPTHLAAAASRFPAYAWAEAARERAAAAERRAEFAAFIGAWPRLGSYAWAIAGNRSATGFPWIGGFPQTGIQTPSIMHFAENRSAEGASNRIEGIGMEFAGAPFILIGQTDTVAYTTTTAQLPIVDTFFERIVGEDAALMRYLDEGVPAPLSSRVETFRGGVAPDQIRTFFRTHDRGGNGGSRAVIDFVGDRGGRADSATATTLVDAGAFDTGYVGGHVAITGGPGAGQIRAIVAVPNANTLTVAAWGTTPTNASDYVAVKAGGTIMAAAVDSAAWLEESTTVLGFAGFQRAESSLDIRAAMRLIPTTHNFISADNLAWNGIGVMSGGGNIGYQSSGFSRIRQGGEDPRLPLDGSSATNPLLFASGVVGSSSPTTLTAVGSPFTGEDFSPPPPNFRYDDPSQLGSEYVVIITGGAGYKQSRRIASNDPSTLTIAFPWGVDPAPGDTFEVQQVIAMPDAINPAEGFMANWNNKAATADPGDGFGREHRVSAILERLAADSSWDRTDNRQLNDDVAGYDGKGKLGRYLLPRLREAVDRVGNGGNPAVDTVLAALEAHNAAPDLGRRFIDPVLATSEAGEISFLNNLINRLGADIYGDEYAGAVGNPTSTRAFNLIQHAIDSRAGDLAGGYQQAYAGDYFNASGTPGDFVCFGTKTTAGTPKFSPVAVTLVDDVGTASAVVKKPRTLCAPADTGDGIVDPDTHLAVYQIAASPNARQDGVAVTDRFGSLTLDLRTADRLLVPSGKRLDAPADPPAAALDHFSCFKARTSPGTPKFVPVQVSASDQFQTRVYDVTKPLRLCVPADKNGEGVQNALAAVLCYKAKRATGQPAHERVVGRIHLNDQFGAQRVDTSREKELCVAATLGGQGVEGWEVTVRNSLSALATGGIPADPPRAQSTYRHPLAALFPVLVFEPTPQGNRGTYEQIVDVGPTVNGEFIFPLGQSGHIEGGLPPTGVTFIDPNFTSLHPIWRDWRFVPMLHVGEDLAGAPTGDADGDGVLDGYERWYYGNTAEVAGSDTDGDGATLLTEFTEGSDPLDPDTDDDGIQDGADGEPQNRLLP